MTGIGVLQECDGGLMLFRVFIVYLYFLPFIYPTYLFFLLRHYFWLVNSSFCHVLVHGGGPHTNHHNVHNFYSSFVFRGIINKYVYSVRLVFFNCSPPPHTVNMGLSLEVHGALGLFWLMWIDSDMFNWGILVFFLFWRYVLVSEWV